MWNGHLARHRQDACATAKLRTSELHPGAIATSDDFDEPLSEEFWMGEK